MPERLRVRERRLRFRLQSPVRGGGRYGVEIDPTVCPADIPEDGSTCSAKLHCEYDIEGD